MTKNNFDILIKGDNMSRQLSKLTSICLALLILVLVGGCSDDDCPTCPKDEAVKPYKGFLYYVELNPQLYDVYVVEMETDSIVDSIDVPDEPTGFLDVSSDGQYLAVTSSPLEDIGVHCYLYDAQTREFIRELPDRMVPFFDVTHNLVVGNVPFENDAYGGVRILSYPSFSLVYEDTTLSGFGTDLIDAPHHKIYGRSDSRIHSYDYINRTFTSHPIIDQIYGHECTIKQFCLNPAGTKIYFKAGVGGSPEYEMIGAFDLAASQLLWYKIIRGPWGGIAVSPDDREIYADEVGSSHGINPGVLFVIDSQTGVQLQAFSLAGHSSTNPHFLIAAESFIYSPTGEKLYIGGGSLARGGGMLATFDPIEREWIKFITPDFNRGVGHRMVIGPKR